MKVVPISVLIPTMNRPGALKRTLAGYLEGNCIPKQIVVVDQSQDENTAKENIAVVESCRSFTEIVYVYQKVASLTKARNCALTKASEDILVCSDDDVDVYKNTICNVYRIMQDSSIAMIAGIDDNMPSSSSKVGYFLGTKSFFKRNIGHVTASMLGRFPERFNEVTETMWAMGFFFVVRKSLLAKWNLQWDEQLTSYAYAEDLDFSYEYYKKAKREFLRCIIAKSIHVRHLTSQEYRIPSRKSTFMYVLNRAYLSHKHQMGWKSELAMNWCNFWMYMRRKMKSEEPHDMADAMRVLRKNRKKIHNGQLDFCE